jgi:hypothetical protein
MALRRTPTGISRSEVAHKNTFTEILGSNLTLSMIACDIALKTNDHSCINLLFL